MFVYIPKACLAVLKVTLPLLLLLLLAYTSIMLNVMKIETMTSFTAYEAVKDCGFTF